MGIVCSGKWRLTPAYRVPSLPVSEANMLCEDTHLVKNVALLASCVKLYVLISPSTRSILIFSRFVPPKL